MIKRLAFVVIAVHFTLLSSCVNSNKEKNQMRETSSINNEKINNEKILFIHGFPMSKKIWRSQLEVLQKSYNCYAVDLPGYGGNLKNTNFTHSIDSYADFVYGYLLENGMEKAHIVGMSMGGSIALNLTRRYPKVVKTLTIIHTSAIPDTNEEKLNRDKTITQIENGGLSSFVENFADRLLSSSASSDVYNKYVSDMNEASKEIVIAGYKAIRNRPDEFKSLKLIKVPVLVVAGSDDIGSSPKEMQEISEEISNSTFKVINDCGHVAPLEKPDELNRILLEWFDNKKD
jgi:pimeloyl-ACP methyl ester carboxylesterase